MVEFETESQHSHWRAFLKQTAVSVLVHSVINMAIIALVMYFGKPRIAAFLPQPWSDIVTALLCFVLCAPFLWMLMRSASHSDDVIALWNESRAARVKIIAFQLLRFVMGAAFVSYIVGHTVHWSGMLGIFVVLAVVFSIVFSPHLKKHSESMTKTFNENLSQREHTKTE